MQISPKDSPKNPANQSFNVAPRYGRYKKVYPMKVEHSRKAKS